MKLIFVCLLLVVTNQAFAYAGLEECHNDSAGVRSIAHQIGGVSWTYTYAGKNYEISWADAMVTPADQLPVEHVAETTTSLSCASGEVADRTSVRSIVLRDSNHHVILKTDVQCEGRLPTGLLSPEPSNPCRP